MPDNVIEVIAKGKDLVTPVFKKMGKGVSNSIKGITGSIFSLKTGLTVLAGVGGVGLLVKSFVTAASQMEDFRTRLISLTKSEELAEEKLRSLSDFAARAPFELPAIIEAGVTLEAFGATAEDTIEPLGDLAAFMGIGIVEASGAFGRAFAAGAGAADILRERGVLTLIKLQTGIEDLTKLTLPEFRRAMLDAMTDPDGKIFGATERLATTFTGQVSMMGDALFSLRETIGSALLPVMKDLVTNHIVPIIKRIRDWAHANRELIGIKFREFIGSLLTALKFLVKGFVEVIIQSGALLGVFKAIRGAAVGVASGVIKLAEAFTRLQIIAKIFQSMGKGKEQVEEIALSIFKLQRRADKLGTLASNLADTSLKSFEEALEAIKNKSGKTSTVIQGLIDAFTKARKESEAFEFVGPPEPEVGPPEELFEINKIKEESLVLSKKERKEIDRLIEKSKELGMSQLQLFEQQRERLFQRLEESKATEQERLEFLKAADRIEGALLDEKITREMEGEQRLAEEKERLRQEELNRVSEHGDLLGGVLKARLELFVENAQSSSAIIADTIMSISGQIKNSIDDALFALITQTGNMEEIWKSLWQSMLKTVISAVTQIIVQQLLMLAAQLLGIKTAAISETATNAAEVYGNSFASAAAIPIYGWAMAPGAAAANLGIFLAGVTAASAAGAGAGAGVAALAEGGIVTKPTLALIGEAGPEVVTPLDRVASVTRGRAGTNTPVIIQKIEMFPNITEGDALLDIPDTTLERWARLSLIPVLDSLNERGIRSEREIV
jgi:hypothetical protein